MHISSPYVITCKKTPSFLWCWQSKNKNQRVILRPIKRIQKFYQQRFALKSILIKYISLKWPVKIKTCAVCEPSFGKSTVGAPCFPQCYLNVRDQKQNHTWYRNTVRIRAEMQKYLILECTLQYWNAEGSDSSIAKLSKGAQCIETPMRRTWKPCRCWEEQCGGSAGTKDLTTSSSPPSPPASQPPHLLTRCLPC